MEKERIIEVLSDWNFWQKELATGILREEYVQKLEKLHKTGQIVVVTGVRRSGKSTLMKQYMKFLLGEGTKRTSLLYVNFEEPKFASELSLEFLQQLYEAYLETVKPEGKPCLFLDEVQLIPRWEKFVRALQEKGEADFIVSGSSAHLLSKEFSTVLTGRHVDLTVYPLSFPEFLVFRGLRLKNRLDLLAQKHKIKGFLREYLESGGFPLVVLQEEKKELLTRYFDDIVVKDVAERYHIKKGEKVKSLARYYLSNISSLASFRKIKEFIGVSLDSIERYSGYLQTAYLIFLVPKFSYKIREQEINPRKVYCIDTGLRNLVSFTFREDIGKIYENIVFLELSKHYPEVFYWAGKQECDFVAKEGKKKELFQVCYQLGKENREREVKALLECMQALGEKSGFIITEDEEGEEKRGGRRIVYTPLWKWLLKEIK